ncbi:MAG: hypothetical protein ACRC6M_06280 [Microcystaceae cyanobacterium]
MLSRKFFSAIADLSVLLRKAIMEDDNLIVDHCDSFSGEAQSSQLFIC